MTTSDILRDWALRLRSLLDAEPQARRIELTLENGSTVSYERAVGLEYVIAGEGTTLRIPEDALDEERWETVP